MGRSSSAGTAVITSSGHRKSHGVSSKQSSTRSRRSSSRHDNCEFMTLYELEQRETEQAQRIRNSNKSSLKSEKTHKSGRKSFKQKSVRFAANPDNGSVWFHVREFEPVKKYQHEELWTTEDEKYDRYEEDMDIVDKVEDDYLDALFPAYSKSAQKSNTVDIDFDSMHERCSEARGLESEVLQGLMSDHVKKHIRAVLKAQALQLHENDESDDDDEESATFRKESTDWKPIREQSLKFSRRSQLIANKLGEYDRDCVTRIDKKGKKGKKHHHHHRH